MPRKKTACKHYFIAEDGTKCETWKDMPGSDKMQFCELCFDGRYKAGVEAPPKPKKTSKSKPAQPQLIALPPPSRHTIALPDGIAVHHGKCGDALKTLPDCSVDAIVTDPPSGIAFMNKKWDKAHGGRDGWIAERREEFAEALRVLKPGAYALVWALPRTSHWTMTALEDAGFEICDIVHHIFGSGNPKGLDISKAIDSHFGAEREKVRTPMTPRSTAGKSFSNKQDERPWMTKVREQGYHEHAGSTPATPEAARYNGYNTALKPATEHWILAQKPREGTYAENVLAWNVGGLNIDASRVGTDEDLVRPAIERNDNIAYGHGLGKGTQVQPSGRWPAHLILSHTPECEEIGDAWECAPGCPVAELDRQSGTLKSGTKNGTPHNTRANVYGVYGPSDNVFQGDEGGASRFFSQLPADEPIPFHYFAKPSRSEKEKGLVDMPAKTGGEATGRKDGSAGLNSPQAGSGRTGGAKNWHPTIKSVALMKWLITLVTPPTAPGEEPPIILDMYAGSGTTGVAAIELGLRCILIEMDAEDEGYIDLIYGRIDHARQRMTRRIAA